ncbi:MAG: [LysW]-aminoadipate kinase [Anaerolineales bacterium]|nr:[LysW]-aminoadipate kinase [Anaerolineales bacterium]
MIIVKVGGGEGINLEAVCRDAAELLGQGEQLVLVHGGSHRTNQVAEALGHPPQFVTSPSGYTSRLTDRRTIGIFEMVYCGEINKGIVERLQALGVDAVGLSGVDGGLWSGPRKDAIRVVENGRQRIVRDNYTGRVEQVNTSLLKILLGGGFLPVLTPPAISFEGEAINVDGDRAAAATAAALGADRLVVLSNVPGVLRSFPDESSLIPRISAAELNQVAEDAAGGRMRIKLLAAGEALAAGVPQVLIGDARCENPIRETLNGSGTLIQ